MTAHGSNSHSSNSPRLLEQIRGVMRLQHKSIRTEEAYIYWIKRFIYFNEKRHPREMGADEIQNYLTFLAGKKRVSASTQNQALAAILFLYKQVLEIDLPWMNDIHRTKWSQHLPVVFTKDEVRALLAQFDGTKWLIYGLIYGCGFRVLECLRLRVKDHCCHVNSLTHRDDSRDGGGRTNFDTRVERVGVG